MHFWNQAYKMLIRPCWYWLWYPGLLLIYLCLMFIIQAYIRFSKSVAHRDELCRPIGRFKIFTSRTIIIYACVCARVCRLQTLQRLQLLQIFIYMHVEYNYRSVGLLYVIQTQAQAYMQCFFSGNAVPIPFLPRLCSLVQGYRLFYMDFAWICITSMIMRS